MPKKIFDESELKRIVSKYVKNVRRDPAKIPDITEVITEALKSAAPEREFDSSDVTRVLTRLSKSPTITDKIIIEAAKKVVDESAFDDLKFLIKRQIRALGKKSGPDDVDKIIKHGKLDPYTSSIVQIRSAVQSYFESGKPLEALTPTELRELIKTELGKHGPIQDQDIRSVMAKYLEDADQEKPFDPVKVQAIIDTILARRGGNQPNAPQGPKTTPIVGPEPTPMSGKVKPGSFIPPVDPRNMTFFEKIRKKLQRYGIKSLSRGSRNWLNDNVTRASKPASRKKLLAEGESVAEAVVGKMFMYFYDAKTKKDLPYWDKFPLIFIIDLLNDGWLGINLHYLDRKLRMRLFDKLLQFANDKSLDKITKLRLSYSFLRNFTQYPEVKPCLKRYLSRQVRSDLITVQPIDWEIALFLPVEQFQKQTKETVWQRSRKMVQDSRRKK
jgi:hypothetical protein